MDLIRGPIETQSSNTKLYSCPIVQVWQSGSFSLNIEGGMWKLEVDIKGGMWGY